MTAFRHRNYALTTTLGRRKRYLVIQLPCMRLNLWRKLSSSYNGVVLSKMSVSDGLVDNIVLSTRLFPTAVNGLLSSAILICDSFLCCCDELWPSQIAIFFVVKVHKNKIVFFLKNGHTYPYWQQKMITENELSYNDLKKNENSSIISVCMCVFFVCW